MFDNLRKKLEGFLGVSPAKTVKTPVVKQPAMTLQNPRQQGMTLQASRQNGISLQTPGYDLSTPKVQKPQYQSQPLQAPRVQTTQMATPVTPRAQSPVVPKLELEKTPKQPQLTMRPAPNNAPKVLTPQAQQQWMQRQNIVNNKKLNEGYQKQKAYEETADIKLDNYGNKSARDYVNDYNKMDVFQQRKLIDDLNKQYKDANQTDTMDAVRREQQAAHLIQAIESQGKKKTGNLLTVAQDFGKGMLSDFTDTADTLGRGLSNLAGTQLNTQESSRNLADTTMSIAVDLYKKGLINDQEFARQKAKAEDQYYLAQRQAERMQGESDPMKMGGATFKAGLLPIAYAAGAGTAGVAAKTGFGAANKTATGLLGKATGMATNATARLNAPVIRALGNSTAAKALTGDVANVATSAASKLPFVSPTAAKLSGVVAENIISGAPAAFGDTGMRLGKDATVQDYLAGQASNAIGSAAFPVAGYALGKGAKVVVRGVQAAADAMPTAQKLTLANPEIQGIKADVDKLFEHKNALLSRGLSPNNAVVVQVDNAIKAAGAEYNRVYKQVYDAAKLEMQRGFIAGPLAGDFSKAKAAGQVFDGVDGKPRFEVDDSGAKYKQPTSVILKDQLKQIEDKNAQLTNKYWFDNSSMTPSELKAFEDANIARIKINEQLSKSGELRFSDIVDHPELYKNYPELADIKVELTGAQELNGKGSFNPTTKVITLDSQVARNPKQALSTLIHEAQHSIQEKEGFAKGSSGILSGDTHEQYLKTAGEAEARAVQARMDMPMSERYVKTDDTVRLPIDKFEKESAPWAPVSKGKVAFHHRDVLEESPGKIKRNHWTKKIANGEEPEVYVDIHNGITRVRDGNHRVNAYLANGKTEIPTKLTPQAKKELGLPDKRSTFYDSLDVPKEDLIIRNDGGKAMSIDDPTAALKQEALSPQAQKLYDTAKDMSDSEIADTLRGLTGYENTPAYQAFKRLSDERTATNSTGNMIVGSKEWNDYHAREAVKKEAQDLATTQRQATQRKDLQGFTDNMSQLQAGKAAKTLDSQIRYNGEVMPKREYIRKLINDGFIPDEKLNKIADPNMKGAYQVVTKTEADYARHLYNQAHAQPTPNVEAPQPDDNIAIGVNKGGGTFTIDGYDARYVDGGKKVAINTGVGEHVVDNPKGQSVETLLKRRGSTRHSSEQALIDQELTANGYYAKQREQQNLVEMKSYKDKIQSASDDELRQLAEIYKDSPDSPYYKAPTEILKERTAPQPTVAPVQKPKQPTAFEKNLEQAGIVPSQSKTTRANQTVAPKGYKTSTAKPAQKTQKTESVTSKSPKKVSPQKSLEVVQKPQKNTQTPSPENTAQKNLPYSDDTPPIDTKQYIKELSKEQSAAGKGKLSVGDKGADFKEKFIDDLAPIEDRLNKAIKAGAEVDPKDHITYQLDRSRRSEGITQAYMNDNDLSKIIQDVPNPKEFDQYLIARHAKELDPEIRTGRDPVKDAALVKQLDGKYGEYAKRVYTYNQKLLDTATEYGLISKETAAALKKKYPEYVPLNRIFKEDELGMLQGNGKGNASISTQGVVKKLKGSERSVRSPLNSIIDKTRVVIEQGERNKAAQMLASYKDLPDNPFNLKEIKANETIGNRNTIAFLDNGKKRVFEVDKEIADAAKNMNRQDIGLWGRIAAVPARVLRAGATGVNAGFAGANVVKDIIGSAINSKHPLRIADPRAMGKALAAALNHNGKFYQELMREGVAGTSFDMYRNPLKSNIGEIRSQKNIATRAAYNATHPKQWYRTLENTIGRSEDFGRALQYYSNKSGFIAEGKNAGDAKILAADQARNNSTNFFRHGSYGKGINLAIPYWNSGVQGARIQTRRIAERPVQTIAKIGLAIAAPSAMIAVNNYSDENKRKVIDDIEDYEKEGNIIIVGDNAKFNEKTGRWDGVTKIPVPPQHLGIHKSIQDAVKSAYTGADYDIIGNLGKIAENYTTIDPTDGRAIANKYTPQGVKLIAEPMTNTNFFTGNKIVPDSQKNLPAADQFGEYTSGTAKAIGKVTNISPRMIDNAIKTGGGGVGRSVTKAIDDTVAADGGVNKSWAGASALLLDPVTKRFSGAQALSPTSKSDKQFDNYKKNIVQSDAYKNASQYDKQRMLNRLQNDLEATAWNATGKSETKLTKKQKDMSENGFKLENYTNLDASAKSTGKADTGWMDEYNAAKSTYQKESKNWTEIQRISKEKELKTLEVKKNFSKDATRLYDMAERDIYAYLDKADDKKANDYLNQIVAYGDRMVEAGIWTTNKLRDKNGNVQYSRGYTGSTRSSKSNGSSTRSSGSTAKKGKFDYKLYGFSSSPSGSGSAKDLYDLLKRATMKG